MVEIGFHASHEQHRPGDLLRYVRQAAETGFSTAMCSDHFRPWTEVGQSGYAWAWLGAALASTTFTYGTVCTPGYRYHPAIVAQASATLAEMFPGRFWLALGSGEALNEGITGGTWPSKAERNELLRECADVIRSLWAGQAVDHAGRIRVRDAKLYTPPQRPPLLFGAAITVETARWLGGWVDGLITVGVSHDSIREVVDAFRDGGGADKPVFLQAAVCLADTEEKALEQAHCRWRHAALPPHVLGTLETPAQFDLATRRVSREELRASVRISSSASELLDSLMRDAALGLEKIFVHHVGDDTPGFIERFGTLLPRASVQRRPNEGASSQGRESP